MFPIAGQTAGPIGLNFFVDTQGRSGGDIGKKKIRNYFFQNLFLNGQRRALQLVLNIYIYVIFNKSKLIFTLFIVWGWEVH